MFPLCSAREKECQTPYWGYVGRQGYRCFRRRIRPELLDNGNAGIVVHQQTVEDLKKAIASLVSDGTRRQELK